jgi:hypothetical protein
MAGLQFVLEDKARTEQKYKKQIQILQVGWHNKTERFQAIVGYWPTNVHEEFKRSKWMYVTGEGGKITSFPDQTLKE